MGLAHSVGSEGTKCQAWNKHFFQETEASLPHDQTDGSRKNESLLVTSVSQAGLSDATSRHLLPQRRSGRSLNSGVRAPDPAPNPAQQ